MPFAMTDTQLGWVQHGNTVRTDQVMIVLYGAGERQQRAVEGLAGRPWWKAPEEWVQNRAAQAERSRLSRRVTPERWDRIALDVIAEDLQYLHEHRGEPMANLFHPRVLDILDDLIVAVQDADRGAVTAGAIRTTPELAERFTPAGIERLVRAEVDRLQHVVDSTLMLSDQTSDGLVVQHHASGLRVRFKRDKSDPGMGVVLAKPYKIPTLDWTDSASEDERGDWWYEYTGLGIGQRLYLHGAALMPEVRWRLTSGTDSSERLRRRLHEVDPWRWESPLCTCRTQWAGFPNPTEALAADHAFRFRENE